MVVLCETYADEYNIRFNSSKSQLIHFTDKKRVKRDISIEMKNESKIKMVDVNIGTTLNSDVKLKHTPDVVRDLTVSLNNLLADFSFVNSSTLSGLFDSYCMNLYGSQLFRYNDIKTWNYYMLHGENQLGKYGKYNLYLNVIYYITLIVMPPLTI